MNEPVLCPTSVWNVNGTTFLNVTNVVPSVSGLFINKNNTFITIDSTNSLIFIWSNENYTTPMILTANITNGSSFFVTGSDEILVYFDCPYHQIERWNLNGSKMSPDIPLLMGCYSLFVDHTNTLYCSQYQEHQVIRQSLYLQSKVIDIVAGMGFPGSTWDMLRRPMGIFVTTNNNLYVADCGNDRVQLFAHGQRNGRTIISNQPQIGVPLNCPSAVVLDAHGYVFVVDQDNHRIIGSDQYGFRCVIGCSGTFGPAANQLWKPTSFSFDRYGNIFVTDTGNHRIQKFSLITNKTCSKFCLVRK